MVFVRSNVRLGVVKGGPSPPQQRGGLEKSLEIQFNFASICFSIGRLKFPFNLLLLELPFVEIWNGVSI